MARYYLHEGGKSLGPFEAQALLEHPAFHPNALVCVAGSVSADAWKQAVDVPELRERLGSVPPPPPPPPPAAVAEASKLRNELTLGLPPGMEPIKREEPLGLDPATKLVLVIEDDDVLRELEVSNLQDQGFKVVSAVNGMDAKEKVAATPPDLILTDLMMPGQGGYEFLRTMEGAANRRLPVFIVSGASLDDSTIDMIRAEANVIRFVRKPVDFGLLLEGIHKTLGTKFRGDTGWRG